MSEVSFKVGDKVEKIGGDYTFVGVVDCVFPKLSGAVRYAVEDDRGVLHLYSAKNLRAYVEIKKGDPDAATPRTDELLHEWHQSPRVSTLIDHSRQLERELFSAQKEIGELLEWKASSCRVLDE